MAVSKAVYKTVFRMRAKSREPANLAEDAYEAIKRAIASFEFQPGATLSENRMGAWLNMSRTPVREAFRRLSRDGLLQRQVGGGSFTVARMTRREIGDTLDLLELVDIYIARNATRNMSRENGKLLLGIARNLRSAAEQHDVAAWKDEDREYHDLQLCLGGNLVAAETSRNLRQRVQRFWVNYEQRTGRMIQCSHEHEQIARAMTRGEADRVEQLIRSHITRLRESLNVMLDAAEPLLGIGDGA
ncbi:GntR family transcriptional regulator [bacterium]|nr:MAG: GntR family transcriptional regulator [bacterium]